MELIDLIDREIVRLQKVKTLLRGEEPPKEKPFKMSPATRKKMAAAQRKRWALLKKV